MKKPKRGESVLQTGTIGAVGPSYDANVLPFRATFRDGSKNQACPQLQMQRLPAPQVNHNQHGVWV